jgi:cell division septum initiation protein DivIVA
MDILHLVDRLEELFNESRAVPLTRQVLVDENKMLDLIDQMRVSIPEEVKKAQQLLSQRDRFMAQAQEEAQRTIQLAREKGEQLVQRDHIMQAANAQAERIIEKARQDSEYTRQEADQYVLQSLEQLRAEMEKILNQVHNGIVTLERDLAPPPSLEPAPPAKSDVVEEPEIEAPDPKEEPAQG